MRREDIDALERAFDRLSAEDREVVVLARIVGMTAAEIAREKESDRRKRAHAAVEGLGPPRGAHAEAGHRTW